MPRDYKKEYNNYHKRPEQKKNRAMRNKARRYMSRMGMVTKGQDVGHKRPLANGGSNSKRNWEAQSVHDNRAEGGRMRSPMSRNRRA